MVADAGRIRQVLLNLVGNALKFTERGHVLVGMERTDEGGPLARIRFSVEDTGIGIEADKLDAVFEKFTQADDSITRRYGGTGLGLSISKQLVELMDGEITVTSTPGRGSTFTFTLTMPVSDDEPVRAAPLADLKGVRVLVLHQHDKVRSVLGEQLEAWGARRTGVATGTAAMSELRAAAVAGDPYHIAIIADNVEDIPVEALALAVKSDATTESTCLVDAYVAGRTGRRGAPARGRVRSYPRGRHGRHSSPASSRRSGASSATACARCSSRATPSTKRAHAAGRKTSFPLTLVARSHVPPRSCCSRGSQNGNWHALQKSLRRDVLPLPRSTHARICSLPLRELVVCPLFLLRGCRADARHGVLGSR